MTRGAAAYLTDDERAERLVAHRTMRTAIRKGLLVRGSCVGPGRFHRGLIAGHHRNGYADPLDVVWLCATHHGTEHHAMNYERTMAAYHGRLAEGTPA